MCVCVCVSILCIYIYIYIYIYISLHNDIVENKTDKISNKAKLIYLETFYKITNKEKVS